MASFTENNPLVYTVKNLCKVCYTCVRECPVKAIRIINGQAEVIPERCIACGNCVKVCSQGAKVFARSKREVFDLLREDKTSVACIAPSFPAEFDEIKDYRELVGMIRKADKLNGVRRAITVASTFSDPTGSDPELFASMDIACKKGDLSDEKFLTAIFFF